MAQPGDTMSQTQREADIQRLERLAWWLDARVRIPGTSARFGLDGLLGLVPGLGDGATAIASVYIILEARRLGVPMRLLVRMFVNVLVDAGVGTIPLAGDLFDFAFKANLRNVALIRRHFGLAPTADLPPGRSP